MLGGSKDRVRSAARQRSPGSDREPDNHHYQQQQQQQQQHLQQQAREQRRHHHHHSHPHHHRRPPPPVMDPPPPSPPPPPPPLAEDECAAFDDDDEDDGAEEEERVDVKSNNNNHVALREAATMVRASWDVPTLPARRPRADSPPPPTIPTRPARNNNVPETGNHGNVVHVPVITPTRSYRHRTRDAHRTFQFIMLSAMYAKLLVVICICVVTAEVITHRVPLYYYEGFFTYLYGLSIIFLLYVFMCLLRASTKRNSQSRKEPLLAPPSPQKGDSKEDAEAALTSPTPAHKKKKVSEAPLHQASIFLRLGAIAFGLGTMIYIGLELGSFFEIPMTSPCHEIMRGVNPILQVIFTFAQMYYIFMNSRLNITKCKACARFGLMHIIATNICVWIRTVARETMKDMSLQADPEDNPWDEDYMILRTLGNQTNETTCQRVDIMGTIIGDSAPYLFPLLYQYCVVAVGVVYITWRNIGRGRPAVEAEPSPEASPTDSSPDKAGGAEGAPGETSKASSSSSVAKVDCVGSSKGLFLGLIVLVAASISLILFFVLVGHSQFNRLAIYFADVSESAVLAISLLAMIMGFARIQSLRFQSERYDLLADLFLRLATFGVYLYSIFGLIAGGLSSLTSEPNLLVLITSCLTIVQATVQTLFVADVSRRVSCISEHGRNKPGRQVVTFLLICNITLYIIETFELQRVVVNPVQLEFYGQLAWLSVQRLCIPLTIFYRFHSSVMLASVWKNAYRVQPN